MHGPNGGLVVELGEGYHLEWEHEDEAGLVTVYLLDKEAKNIPESEINEITIESTVGDKTTPYTLPRVGSESETKKTTKFETTDKALLTALLMTEGVTNTVKVTVDGKELTGKIKYDPSFDH
jgi:hypothetical protein